VSHTPVLTTSIGQELNANNAFTRACAATHNNQVTVAAAPRCLDRGNNHIKGEPLLIEE